MDVYQIISTICNNEMFHKEGVFGSLPLHVMREAKVMCIRVARQCLNMNLLFGRGLLSPVSYLYNNVVF